jgi:tetratricopeptide (TPR) repeat protein
MTSQETLTPEDYIPALWPAIRENAIEQFIASPEGKAFIKQQGDDQESLNTVQTLMGLELDTILTHVLDGKTIAQIQGLNEVHLSAIYTVGESRMQVGEIEEAASLFHLLIILDPTIARHYTAFGACQQMLKKYEYALEMYAIAQVQDMSDPRVPQNGAMCCVFLNRFSQARGMAVRSLSMCETAILNIDESGKVQSAERSELERLAEKSRQLIQLITIRERNVASAETDTV